MRAAREAATAEGLEVPETESLWYPEPRADVAQWLKHRGWVVDAVCSGDLITRYHRPAPAAAADAAPSSLFIKAVRG